MKIEKEQVQLQAFQLTSSGDGGVLTLLSSRKNFRLNSLQTSYLDVLRNSGSIEGLIQFFLGQGWLVSFRELYQLLDFLVSEGILLNPSFREYFLKFAPQNLQFSNSTFETKMQTGSLNPQDLPFFRSLEPELAKFLLKGAEKFSVPAQMRITQTGKMERDLFIMMKGQAAIYRVMDEKHRQMISLLNSGAIFGERGFLLNQPRSADVITTLPSEILRVRYLPEFDQLIKSEKAQSLQHRFWVLQALQSSAFFKNLPSDSLDSLIFSGRMVQAPAHQVLFQEGQHGNTCYILIQGNVVISQRGKNINVLGQGSAFGEISLLMSGGQRTATVTTQQNSVLLEIQQTDFYRVLSQNLILAKEIESLAAQRLQNDTTRR
ncbi:cyclic nucleotide-binding domain-containing protein [Bdellovibrio sp. 22V]|uniref:cyclic nucleotide-binding domain-containing protein n=1 Tax=Bdellovibrio TaxID=958 RepID=UPI002542FD0B|nr:cyclic nucleotide-binding domain-containing protein [Bdellovibrio sp. 22V]WII72017.1 cyclic nucleotide-binding domain-containing protein [Bdellovibrio sp. 22V]